MACTHCGSADTRLVVGPFGPHYGKIICQSCSRQIRWAKKPDPSRGSLPSSEIMAMVHPREKACPLRGTAAQVRAGRAIRNSLLYRLRGTCWMKYYTLIMCINDATWFLANGGKEPDSLRWPSPRQMEVATFPTPCEACGQTAYGGESVCSEECADVLAERAL